jgi:hypothetical protein
VRRFLSADEHKEMNRRKWGFLFSYIDWLYHHIYWLFHHMEEKIKSRVTCSRSIYFPAVKQGLILG